MAQGVGRRDQLLFRAYGEKFDPLILFDSKRDVANLLHEEAEVRSVWEFVRQKKNSNSSHSKSRTRRKTSRQLGAIKFQRECILNDALPFQKTIF